jgi:anti-sigma factor RsiW
MNAQRLSAADQRLAARYIDGELEPAARAAFAGRLPHEPLLRAAVDELAELRATLRALPEPPGAPRGFAPAVLDRVRRLPSPVQLQADELEVVRVAHWLLLAAGLILGASLLIVSGLLRPLGDGRLEAAKEELKQIVEQIHARDGGEPLVPRGR